LLAMAVFTIIRFAFSEPLFRVRYRATVADILSRLMPR
jgi:hypothetical protein